MQSITEAKASLLLALTVLQLIPLALQPARAQQVVANGVTVTASGTINTGTTDGEPGMGLRALNGGVIQSFSPLTVITGGMNAVGAQASFGGTINLFDGTSIHTTGLFGDGLAATNGRITATNTTILTEQDGYGAVVGTAGEISLVGGSITALVGNGGATFEGGILNLNNTTVTTYTSLALWAQDAGSTITATGATITANAARGVLVSNGAKVSLINSSVTSSGGGIQAFNVGTVILDNTKVETSGTSAYGVALATGSSLTMTGSSIATAGSGARALYSYSGTNTATITDSTLTSAQSSGIRVYASTLNASVTGSSITGHPSVIEVGFAGSTAATLNLTADNSTLNGAATLVAGSTSNVVLTNGSTWIVTGDSTLTSLTNDPSTVAFSAPVNGTFKTLTVNNYTGNGGTLVMNTVLGADASPTDKLVIDGGSATGTSLLRIVNANGPGALTVADGILVVEAVNGATTASSAFSLSGRVAAGAYDYLLYYGGNASSGGDPANQNWYLRSTLQVVDPEIPGVIDEVPDYRPEVPLVASITPIAMEYGYAMLGTLHERVGEIWTAPLPPAYEERTVRGKNGRQQVVRVPVVATDQTKWASSGWARLIGDRGFRDNDSFLRHGPDYDYTFAGIQAGLDVYAREQANGALDKAGVYVGYGQIDANVKGAWRGKAGSIDMDAYTLGAYWTHKAAQGWYSDAVVQGTWYSAEAKSTEGVRFKPDGFGIVASLEGGYAFNLGNGVTIEPQAQLAYQNVSFDDVSDPYGRFSLSDGESLRGRLGVRLAKAWNVADAARPRLLSTWLRANVWHEFIGDPSTTVTGLSGANPVTFTSSLGGTWGEIGAGVSGQVSDTVALFGTAAYNRSLDNKGREAWNGRLGVTVKW